MGGCQIANTLLRLFAGRATFRKTYASVVATVIGSFGITVRAVALAIAFILYSLCLLVREF